MTAKAETLRYFASPQEYSRPRSKWQATAIYKAWFGRDSEIGKFVSQMQCMLFVDAV